MALSGKPLKLFTQKFHGGKLVQASSSTAATAKNKTAVVFCHGLMGSCANWHSVAADVSKRLPSLGAAVVMDMRNHGRSPHSSNSNTTTSNGNAAENNKMMYAESELHTAHSMALDLAHWVETPTEQGGGSDYDNIILLGHSMGGVAVSTALVNAEHQRGVAMAHAHPGINFQQSENSLMYSALGKKVRGGIIVDVSPSGRLKDQFKEIDGLLTTLLRDIPLTPDTSLEVANTLVKDKIKDQMMRGFLLMNLLGGNPKTQTPASWKCNLPLLHASLGHMLFPYQEHQMSHHRNAGGGGIPRVQLPTLHVFGEKSPYNYPEGRAAINHFFDPTGDRTTVVEMKNGGHYLHYQMKDKFVDTIAPWIQKVLHL